MKKRDPWPYPEGLVHTVARYLGTNEIESQRLGCAFAADNDLHVRPLRSFQHVGDFGAGGCIDALVIYLQQHISRANAGFISRSATEWMDHHGFPGPRLGGNGHSHAVVLSVLFFP